MIIYTDGSYNRKLTRDVAGYAAACIMQIRPDSFLVNVHYGVVEAPEYVEMWNVGGEIFAVLSGIRVAKNLYDAVDFELFYDYEGIEKWATGKWQAKNPTTQGYKKYMRTLASEYRVTFTHVKGHSGDPLNELVDHYAGKAITDFLREDKSAQVEKGIRIPR